MKYTLLVTLLAILVMAVVGDAQRPRRPRPPRPPALTVNIPCPASITQIEDCSDIGCSNERAFDPKLNQRKNIRTSSSRPIDKNFSDLAGLDDPVRGFMEGGSREALKTLGEGETIRVVAYAVDVRAGSQESCNCGLGRVRDTDNHIVLIDPTDRSPSLADEPNSLTAEFTPRVRLSHPKLSRAQLRPLILAAPRQALLVRVTGLQMFDSFHSLHNPVPKGRDNNWEIHPVFHMEYCPNGRRCTAGSDVNWKNLEQ